MAADNTLVQASFKESLSRAGSGVPNLKPLYDNTADTIKAYTGIVTGAMDAFKKDEEAKKIGKENQLKRFKAIVAKGEEDLSAGETMPESILNALDSKIRSLQDEFELVNTYGKSDTAENERARNRINGKLRKVINQAINARKTFTDIGKSVDNWNNDEISSDVIAPLTQIMDINNMDENGTEVSFIGDDLTFTAKNYYEIKGSLDSADKVYDPTKTYNKQEEVVISRYGDPVTYNLKQMQDAVPQKDVSADAEILKLYNVVRNKGAEDGSDTTKENSFDYDYEKGQFTSLIKNESDFRNIARRSIEGLNDKSFREGLMDNLEISVNVLDNIFYDDNGVKVNMGDAFKSLDIEEDGVINSLDIKKAKGLTGEALEAFKYNKSQFLDALTDIDHPAFNLDRSKDLIGEYHALMMKQDYDLTFSKNRKQITEKAANIRMNDTLVSKKDFDNAYGPNSPMMNFINSNEPGSIVTPKGLEYERKQDGKIYYKKDNSIATGNDMLKRERVPGVYKSNISEIEIPPEIPYPSRDITDSNFGEVSSKNILKELRVLYQDFPGFSFDRVGGKLKITGPNKKSVLIKMDRVMFGNKNSRKAIQNFIKKNYTKK